MFFKEDMNKLNWWPSKCTKSVISVIVQIIIFCRGHKIFYKTFYSGGTLFSPTTPNLLSPTNVERGLALKPAANSSFYPRAHCRHRAED